MAPGMVGWYLMVAAFGFDNGDSRHRLRRHAPLRFRRRACRPCLRQDAVHGGDADPKVSRDRIACLARPCHSQHVGRLGASGRCTDLVFALCCGLGDSLALSL